MHDVDFLSPRCVHDSWTERGEGRVEESVGVSNARVSRLLTMFSCNDRVMLLARY